MNKQDLRRAIIEAGIEKIKSIIYDFEERIRDLKDETTKNELQESASQSESRRESDLELLDTLVKQFNFAKGELEILKQIEANKIHDEVEFGSVVITNQRNLFVSTGIEEFEANGEKYFGLSTKAPLYKNMAGLKAGDSLSFNGIEYKIKEVF